MSDARFEEAARSPWDAAVIILTMASIIAAACSVLGLAAVMR